MRGRAKMLNELIELKIETEESRSLWNFLKEIVDSCRHHLSQITTQMKNYDIHDEKHSSKVLENIESLLDDKADELSCYELMIIYASCFLHDAAMALPEWEHDMLRAAEGCEECCDNTIEHFLRNDFKPAQSLANLKTFIDENKEGIYVDFAMVTKFVFSPNDENGFQLDIAKRVHDYQLFRNEFADKLEPLKNDLHTYLNYSNLIRSEFIRKTHHYRIVDYIKNLRQRLSAQVGDAISVRVLDDLAQVCHAHGEPIKFVEGLSLASNVDRIGEANLQFASIILRLGDVIHFSSDRAPLSLFSEKRITDIDSLQHWNAKFNGTRYDIDLYNGKKTINFHAFSSEPSSYYFLHEYLDWIDDEIGYYFSFLHNLDFLKTPAKGRYDLQLNDRVNRSDVIADDAKFIPDHSAKFTMDQSKILTLLMGTQLYKDKYLCLRELYQNSLDACKCMKAQDANTGKSGEYHIIFGLKTDYAGRKYIYCLDNGTGMTKEIVKNYFLRIGNSYYNSREFVSKNVGWADKVKPTSQFGIGVLSCFMMGETIEVTTKYYDEKSDSFSFCLDSRNERFFYLPVDPLDDELVGSHGTLIKIILSEKMSEIINNELPKEYYYFIYSAPQDYKSSKSEMDVYEKFRNSLFYRVNNQLLIPHPNINVWVYDSQDTKHQIVPANRIFDYTSPDIDIEKITSIWSNYHFSRTENPYKEVLACQDYIKTIPIHIEKSGVELDTFISLPLKGIPNTNRYIFSFERYIWLSHSLQIFVDGVAISNTQSKNDYEKLFGYALAQSGHIILNFVGKIRPTLSVDRNSIVSCTDESVLLCGKVVSQLIQRIVDAVVNHLDQQNLEANSPEAYLAFETILTQYKDFSGELIELIGKSKYGTLKIKEYDQHLETSKTLNDIIQNEDSCFRELDFRSLSLLAREIIVGKLFTATMVQLEDLNISISSTNYIAPSSLFKHERRELHDCNYIVRADTWAGKYSEFDIVSSVWPLAPERVFNKITDLYRQDNFLADINRVKMMPSTGNGIFGIASLEAALINPKFGISTYHDDGFGKQKSLIGRCEYIQKQYWLFDLNDHGRLKREEKKDYALFAYIAPKELSEDDGVKLKDFIGRDDTYVKGVQEGWSILFLGYDQVYFILPGLHNKSELVELIPSTIRDRKDEITYFNLDDTRLFKGTRNCWLKPHIIREHNKQILNTTFH